MKKLFIALLLLSTLILTGCSNFLLADNTVLTIDTNKKQEFIIKSMNTEQPGIVRAKTNDNQVISTNSINDDYSIDLYDPNTSTLVNYITTDYRIFDVKAASDGLFYSRVMVNDPDNIQINWFSFDKATERTITTIADTPDSVLYAYDTDKVVYLDNGNEIVFSNSLGQNNVYTLDFPINLKEIIWCDKAETGFLIGNQDGMDSSDLYQFRINDDNTLNVNKISSNTLDMDLNKDENKLVYLSQNGNKTFIYEISDFKSVSPTPLFSDMNLERVSYNGENLFFSRSENRRTQSTIWFFDRQAQSANQVTSPFGINSPIIVTNNNEIVFSFDERTYQDVTASYQMYSFIANFRFDQNNQNENSPLQ